MTTQEISASTIEKVVVHPLVLRNIVDSHNRIGTSITHVIGVLLGTISRGIVRVTNNYTVPFEEYDIGPSFCYFDREHIENTLNMYKGLNDKEHVLGWFSTIPELRERDLHVHANILRDYVPNPLLVVINVPLVEHGCSPIAYYALEDFSRRSVKEAFVSLSTEIGPPSMVEDIPGGSVLVTEMIPGDDNGLVDFLEDYYLYVKDSVRISVSGYDTSLDAVDLVGYLDKHFESCGSVEDIMVPRHPVTNAITDRCTTVILRGDGAADKALALNGSDAGGWIVSVALLPPEISEMACGMSAREFALRYAGYAVADTP